MENQTIHNILPVLFTQISFVKERFKSKRTHSLDETACLFAYVVSYSFVRMNYCKNDRKYEIVMHCCQEIMHSQNCKAFLTGRTSKHKVTIFQRDVFSFHQWTQHSLKAAALQSKQVED